MAENKTKPTDVSVADFLAAIPDASRRGEAGVLVRMMRKATRKPPKMWGPSIVGFGSYHYVYESGREGDMPVIGFSPRKPAHVLYVRAGSGRLDTLLPKLGKHTTGKDCLYVKKLADVDLKVLEQVIEKAAKTAGKG